ncbi:MAG TPA: hypothetical protein VLB27_00995 [candidate division Zixibacteria bacterium]|nr:hypothetical protein [candidate division Zixibacteria bacterium]
MSLSEYLSEYLFGPLYNRLHGIGEINHAVSDWERIYASPDDERRRLADDRLARLLETAYHETAYFREVIDQRGLAGRLDDPTVLSEFPLLDKPLIRQRPRDFVNHTLPDSQLIRTMTGGSTSDPLEFYRDRNAYCRRWGLQTVCNRRLGWEPGEWYGLVWGAPQDLWDMNSYKVRLVNYLVHRRIGLDASGLTLETVREFFRQLWQKRPRIIYGYPVLLDFTIRLAREHGIEIPTAELVVVTAEKLTTHALRTISETFQCPVIDRYASREFGVVADQVAHTKYLRVAPASLRLEIIPFSQSDPQFGELVITDLLNVGMPFIRYRTGDIARLEEIEIDGRTDLVLSEISGRTTDLIIAPSGKVISGTAALPLFREYPGIDQAQIHQLDYDHFRIFVVKGKLFTQETEDGMRAKMNEYCGEEVRVEFDYVETIPRDPSGKFRVVISHLAEEYLNSQMTPKAQ